MNVGLEWSSNGIKCSIIPYLNYSSFHIGINLEGEIWTHRERNGRYEKYIWSKEGNPKKRIKILFKNEEDAEPFLKQSRRAEQSTHTQQKRKKVMG